MRWRAPVVITVFAVLDVLVIGGAYALSHRQGDPNHSVLARASASSSPSSSPSPLTTDSASTSSGPSAAAQPHWTGPLFLAASVSGDLLRVTRGSCDARDRVAARVWMSPQPQAPLSEVTVPGLQEALGAVITSTRATIVGTGVKCGVFGFTSTDGGATWQRGPVPDDVWYLDTDTTASVVHGPVKGGVEQVDCTPVGVTTRAAGKTAYVACGTQNVTVVRGTADPTVAPVLAPAAADEVGAGRLIALGAAGNCTASVNFIDRALKVTSGPCLGTRSAALGIAASAHTIYAQAGYTLMESSDGGKTFTKYPGQ